MSITISKNSWKIIQSFLAVRENVSRKRGIMHAPSTQHPDQHNMFALNHFLPKTRTSFWKIVMLFCN